MGARSYYVYILASRIGGTLYIGVTNDLVRRAYEHKSGSVEGFTKDYDVNRLVYFECFDEVEVAVLHQPYGARGEPPLPIHSCSHSRSPP